MVLGSDEERDFGAQWKREKKRFKMKGEKAYNAYLKKHEYRVLPTGFKSRSREHKCTERSSSPLLSIT